MLTPTHCYTRCHVHSRVQSKALPLQVHPQRDHAANKGSRSNKRCCPGAGPLPDTWASADSWPHLGLLSLKQNRVSGSLPPAWGASAEAFPALLLLSLDTNLLEGPLPAQWSSGFQSLS